MRSPLPVVCVAIGAPMPSRWAPIHGTTFVQIALYRCPSQPVNGSSLRGPGNVYRRTYTSATRKPKRCAKDQAFSRVSRSENGEYGGANGEVVSRGSMIETTLRNSGWHESLERVAHAGDHELHRDRGQKESHDSR